jgi:hypothetical protein
MNNDSTALARAPQAGMVAREGMAGTELAVSGEMNTAAMVAEARAKIESMHIVAKRFPRNEEDVRIKLLRDCRRPLFAEKARYAKPQGKKKVRDPDSGREVWVENKVEGPSIRFVEAALRHMGNIRQEAQTTYDDADKRKMLISVTDLESNSSFSMEVTIEKTVERRSVKEGADVLGTRKNSYGETVFILRATEDEMQQKQAALISKAIRTNGLRIIPADLIEESMGAVIETQKNRDAEDPDAARKAIADAFFTIGVQPSAIAAYLGHDIAACSPTEMLELRAIYMAIRDGETTWSEVLKSRTGTEEEKEGAKAATEKVEALKKKLDEKAKAKANKAPPPERQSAPAQEPGVNADGEPV